MQIGVETSRAVENKRVFVVDSDEINRAVLQFMLHDENETHELASLDAAYTKARDWKPDVVLLGLAIVQERGTGVFGEIAGWAPGAKILVVADTASNPVAQSCLKSGAHGLLAKPFTVESVRGKVDLMLGRGVTDFIPVALLAANPFRS
jgi:CheY-like chemotaxis protein